MAAMPSTVRPAARSKALPGSRSKLIEDLRYAINRRLDAAADGRRQLCGAPGGRHSGRPVKGMAGAAETGAGEGEGCRSTGREIGSGCRSRDSGWATH